MKIETLSQFASLLKLARKHGVQSLRVDGIEFHLGDIPTPKATSKLSKRIEPTMPLGQVDINTPIPTPDALSEEQMLYYSSSGGVTSV